MSQEQEQKAPLTTHDKTRLVSEVTAILEAKGLAEHEICETLLLAFQVNAGYGVVSFLKTFGIKD